CVPPVLLIVIGILSTDLHTVLELVLLFFTQTYIRLDPGQRLRSVPAASYQLLLALRRIPAPAPATDAAGAATAAGLRRRRPGQQRDRGQRLSGPWRYRTDRSRSSAPGPGAPRSPR